MLCPAVDLKYLPRVFRLPLLPLVLLFLVLVLDIAASQYASHDSFGYFWGWDLLVCINAQMRMLVSAHNIYATRPISPLDF
jgi:hypothetical protein